MLLPESLGEGGVDISMDQGKSFVDYQNGVRFSYDELYRTSLPYYEKSYPNISQGENSADFILNLAVHLRRSSLYANQVSLVEKIKGKYGNDIRTIIVTGKENSYDKSYAYVYATNNNDYYTYLYQFVCLEENLKFYYQEIVNCLASTK